MAPQPQKQRPFLTLKDATFRLGDRLVFEHTNWTFHRLEQWAIIGPNGSGKTILGDGLRGRLPLVGGELSYHFRPPRNLTQEESIGHVAFEDRKSELHGTVVQSCWASFEEEASLSVSDFLSYERVMEINPFEINPYHATARRLFERRLHQAIGLFQIGSFLRRTLLSLSNGERQRVQLARAMARPVRLLILDEPYVGLDSLARDHFYGILERLLETGLRALLITTRIEDLPRHITHLLRVDECKVVAAGPRAELMTRRNGALSVGCSRPFAQSTHTPLRKVIPKNDRQPLTTATKLLELRNITVKYGGSVILHQLNWTVRQGESWALLGPNGSGKTTLLSLILGDNPQAYMNDVVVFGRPRGSGESVWQLRAHIGWVSPELQLHFDDTISASDVVLSGFYETIGLFETPTPAQSAAARRWLRRFGLVEFAEFPLFSLSAGLQRMALLACALVKSPRLLILDEPCQGLDAAHRDLIISTVDALIRSRSVSTIFVTHRPEEIPPSIKRVLRLHSPKHG